MSSSQHPTAENPIFLLEMYDNGEITAIKVTQSEFYKGQMLDYSKNHCFLKEDN